MIAMRLLVYKIPDHVNKTKNNLIIKINFLILLKRKIKLKIPISVKNGLKINRQLKIKMIKYIITIQKDLKI